MYDEAAGAGDPKPRLVAASQSWNGAEPRISVLIPTYRDDPVQLLAALNDEFEAGGAPVEAITLDDGAGEQALSERIARQVEALALPAAFYAFERNRGRAAARNMLTRLARGGHFLFLDADMLPDAPGFLARYLREAEAGQPVVFGGFSVDQVKPTPATALHHYTTRRSDCLPAGERQKDSAGRVCTSNLMVRRDVLAAEPFDTGFKGWGWEDVEWALRAAKRWPIRHIDNTATHLGLDDARTLLRKYAGAGANYAAMAARHPEVQGFRLFKTALQLSMIPGVRWVLPALERLALGAGPLQAPLKVRSAALKLHRAIAYAPHLAQLGADARAHNAEIRSGSETT